MTFKRRLVFAKEDGRQHQAEENEMRQVATSMNTTMHFVHGKLLIFDANVVIVVFVS